MQKLGDWLNNIIPLAAEAGADIIFLQDDYGCNQRPLISMKMWRDITFPQLSRLVRTSHELQKPFMLHSCGFQMPFLPYYLEAGIDVLQSLQSGAGNDLSRAIKDTHGNLAFATGIDVQQAETLSADKFFTSMREAAETGRKHGKFIFGTTHMLQHSLSDEKLELIFQTIANVKLQFA
jgi:uroporphyrinogen decarboxylase